MKSFIVNVGNGVKESEVIMRKGIEHFLHWKKPRKIEEKKTPPKNND